MTNAHFRLASPEIELNYYLLEVHTYRKDELKGGKNE